VSPRVWAVIIIVCVVVVAIILFSSAAGFSTSQGTLPPH
jgi:predicted PurR-regulated permease PerM